MKIDHITARKVMNLLHALKVRMNIEFDAELVDPGDGGVPILMTVTFLGKKIWLPIFSEKMEDEEGKLIEPQSVDEVVNEACETIETIIAAQVSNTELALIQQVLAKREAETDIAMEETQNPNLSEPEETPAIVEV